MVYEDGCESDCDDAYDGYGSDCGFVVGDDDEDEAPQAVVEKKVIGCNARY